MISVCFVFLYVNSHACRFLSLYKCIIITQLTLWIFVLYSTELRSIGSSWNFSDQFNTLLWDQLVCGLRKAGIQQHFMIEADLTLEKALKIAQNVETANKSLKGTANAEMDDKLADKFLQILSQVTVLCYQCGKKNYRPCQCKLKDATCHFCKRRDTLCQCVGKSRPPPPMEI